MTTLYRYKNIIETDQDLSCDIEIYADHEVFLGHFPEHPVLPGVCMIEMMVDRISQHFGRRYRLQTSSMIKFVGMWLPQETTSAYMLISYEELVDQIKVKNCVISSENNTHFKFKGSLHAEK